MALVGIILLNYNGNSDTIECLESLETYLKSSEFQFKIYLLDNNSKKPIAEDELTGFNLNITYKKNNVNYGFAGGNNIGMEMAVKDSCDYVMLLNNDTVLTDYSLVETISYMEANPKIGVAGIVNFYYDKPEEKWQDGWNVDLAKGHGRRIDESKKVNVDFVESDYVPGSSMIIRREVIDKIGLLDDRFFAYYEDSDFCARTRKIGYKVGFNPKSHLLHKVSRSSTSYIRNYLRTRNRLMFYSRYSTWINFVWIYLTTFRRCFNVIRKEYKTTENPKLLMRSYLWAFNDFNSKNFKEGRIQQLK